LLDSINDSIGKEAKQHSSAAYKILTGAYKETTNVILSFTKNTCVTELLVIGN
jgi:hypothetical protein